jgi:hypothetical protein
MNKDNRSITIGGVEYPLILTMRAAKEIGKRYGGLGQLGDMLLNKENIAQAVDELSFLITLLANQGILIHNLQHPSDKKPLLTEEAVELLTTPWEMAGFKDAITDATTRGLTRAVESEPDAKNG